MRYILAVILSLSCYTAFAANCVLDKNNNVVAKMAYTPDMKDLESRGEALIQCDDSTVVGDADFRNNKVVKHVPTQDEISTKAQMKADRQARKDAQASATIKLKALNLTDDEIKAILP